MVRVVIKMYGFTKIEYCNHSEITSQSLVKFNHSIEVYVLAHLRFEYWCTR